MSVELKCRRCGQPMHRDGGMWLTGGSNSWCVDEGSHQPPLRWFQDHRNMILLVRHLADDEATGDQVAWAVEKPWLYSEEFIDAGGEIDDYTKWLAENDSEDPGWTT